MECLQVADASLIFAGFIIGLIVGPAMALVIGSPVEHAMRVWLTPFVKPILRGLENRREEKERKLNEFLQSPEFIRAKDAENINRRLSELDLSGWKFKGYSESIAAQPIFVRTDGAEVAVDDFGRDVKLSALKEYDAQHPLAS